MWNKIPNFNTLIAYKKDCCNFEVLNRGRVNKDDVELQVVCE